MDNPREIPISSTSGKIYGQLHINVVPCDASGNEDLDDDQLNDEPSELLSQPLDFKVYIDKITDLPEDFCNNIFCEYKFYMDDTTHRTELCQGKNTNPEIGYVRQHHVDCVTQFLLDYLTEDKLTIKILGNQELRKKGTVQ